MGKRRYGEHDTLSDQIMLQYLLELHEKDAIEADAEL